MDVWLDVLPWPTVVVAGVTVGGAGVASRASDEDDATLHRAALTGSDATQHRPAPLRVGVVGGMDVWPDVLPWPTAVVAGVTVGGEGATDGASMGDDATQNLPPPLRVVVVGGMDLWPVLLPWPVAVVVGVMVGGAGAAGGASIGHDSTQNRPPPLCVVVVGEIDLWPGLLSWPVAVVVGVIVGSAASGSSTRDDAILHRLALTGDAAAQHCTAILRVGVVGGMDLWPEVPLDRRRRWRA